MVQPIAMLLVASTTILIVGSDDNGPQNPLADAGRRAGAQPLSLVTRKGVEHG